MSLCFFCSSIFSGRSLFALAQLNWGSSSPGWSGDGMNVHRVFFACFAFFLSTFVFKAVPSTIMLLRFEIWLSVSLLLTWSCSILRLTIARFLLKFLSVSFLLRTCLLISNCLSLSFPGCFFEDVFLNYFFFSQVFDFSHPYF